MNMKKVEETDDLNVIQIKYENIIIFSFGLELSHILVAKYK